MRLLRKIKWALQDLNKTIDAQLKKYLERKTGGTKMETKSRYEIMNEMNERKQGLIIKKANLKEELRHRQKEVKAKERALEDLKDDVKAFEESMKEQEQAYDLLIKEVDNSMEKLAQLHGQGKN